MPASVLLASVVPAVLSLLEVVEGSVVADVSFGSSVLEVSTVVCGAAVLVETTAESDGSGRSVPLAVDKSRRDSHACRPGTSARTGRRLEGCGDPSVVGRNHGNFMRWLLRDRCVC